MGFLSERQLLFAVLIPNYGSRRLKANRFRSPDAHSASVCHARSRRIACGVRLQVAAAVSENRAAAAGTQHQSVIRKSGYRFSEKIMREQKDRAG
jgi:predicted  nucleic acid-binding Zn ribbon protein